MPPSSEGDFSISKENDTPAAAEKITSVPQTTVADDLAPVKEQKFAEPLETISSTVEKINQKDDVKPLPKKRKHINKLGILKYAKFE